MESIETLTPAQLLKLTQIELRCVQECAIVFETTLRSASATLFGSMRTPPIA